LDFKKRKKCGSEGNFKKAERGTRVVKKAGLAKTGREKRK